jgi:serine/threonine-protein kinase
MATLYEAMHVTLGMTVAVKVLSRKYAQNPMVVTRFLNEARALALLDHRNVVRIIDFDLVGPVLQGETLSARLHGGKVSPEVALRIAAQLGSAQTSHA